MLIFFDIDGTLIGEQSHVMLESTKEAVQRARSLGHICMINTGRSGKLVGADVTGLTEFDGLAMGCGTMIVYRGETLFHRTFSEEESHRIVAGLRRHGSTRVWRAVRKTTGTVTKEFSRLPSGSLSIGLTEWVTEPLRRRRDILTNSMPMQIRWRKWIPSGRNLQICWIL